MNEIIRGRLEPAAVERAMAELAAAFGNRLVTSQAMREQHGNTTTWIASAATGRYHISTVVRRCAASCPHLRPPSRACHSVRGRNAFEGHVNAPLGGVSLDFKDMNRVVAVHVEDFDCVVEPGVTRKLLNEHLRDQGCSFPSILAPTLRWVEWPRRAPRERPRFATEP